MSEPTEKPPGAAAGGDDPLKNVKAEFDRKLTNITADMTKKFEESQTELLRQIQAMRQPAPQAPVDEDLSDLVYKDPNKLVERITQKVSAAVDSKLETRNKEATKQQQVIGGLVGEFPELTDGEHDLTKLAVTKFNAMDPEDRKSPVAYKTAVTEAALELGIKPKSKRSAPSADDDFQLGSGSGGNRESKKMSKKAEQDIAALSELFGVDAKKVSERAAKRTNYGKWE